MTGGAGVDPEPGRAGASRGMVFLVLLALTIGLAVAVSIIGSTADQPSPRGTSAHASEPADRTSTPLDRTSTPLERKETALPGIGGLAVDGQAGHAFLAFSDPNAGRGAWTVVIRRADGSLGQHGAVVTYPVSRSGDADGGSADSGSTGGGSASNGSAVRVGSVTGVARPGVIIWPLGNGHARIRGDLPTADLVRLAEGTRVVAGRPLVTPPPSFRVAAVAPSRLPLIHEIRYGSDWLGVRVAPVDGLTATALTTGGGFEDALFAAGVAPGGTVHGSPAVVSPARGGSGTLSWEPAAGVVAYIGWSGAEMSPKVLTALRALAESTYTLTPGQWLATSPELTEQENNPAG